MKSQIQVGDKVVILLEYHLMFDCRVTKINKKSIKVEIPAQGSLIAHSRLVKPERVAKYGDPLCIVWQQWKTMSTVSYRFEYTLYPQYHRPVETWSNGFFYGQNIKYIEEYQPGVFGKAV